MWTKKMDTQGMFFVEEVARLVTRRRKICCLFRLRLVCSSLLLFFFSFFFLLCLSLSQHRWTRRRKKGKIDKCLRSVLLYSKWVSHVCPSFFSLFVYPFSSSFSLSSHCLRLHACVKMYNELSSGSSFVFCELVNATKRWNDLSSYLLIIR